MGMGSTFSFTEKKVLVNPENSVGAKFEVEKFE